MTIVFQLRLWIYTYWSLAPGVGIGSVCFSKAREFSFCLGGTELLRDGIAWRAQGGIFPAKKQCGLFWDHMRNQNTTRDQKRTQDLCIFQNWKTKTANTAKSAKTAKVAAEFWTRRSCFNKPRCGCCGGGRRGIEFMRQGFLRLGFPGRFAVEWRQ